MKRIKIISLLLFTGCILSAQNSVEWRYDRTGIYSNETELLKSWAENGPELLWHFDGLGQGYTSVSVDNDKLFVTGYTEGKGYLYVLNLNGKLLYKIEYGTEWDADSYIGSRSTVIPNDEKLYIVSGNAELFCFDMQSLQLLWKKNYAKDYEAENTKHGWHGPPLIVGEKLIIATGGEKHNVVALDKTTGNIIWSSEGKGVMAGYGVPIFVKDQQTPQIVAMMSDYIIGLDESNGKLL
jgi:outer membrane protein assembly factor BamB